MHTKLQIGVLFGLAEAFHEEKVHEDVDNQGGSYSQIVGCHRSDDAAENAHIRMD